MISSPGCVSSYWGLWFPAPSSTIVWRTARPVTLRSCRWRSMRRAPTSCACATWSAQTAGDDQHCYRHDHSRFHVDSLLPEITDKHDGAREVDLNPFTVDRTGNVALRKVSSTHCPDPLRGVADTARSLTGNFKSIQLAMPPWSGRTRTMPRRLSRSATRALVASLGQEQ